VPPEREILRLGEWLGPGDWAIDIGANIGYYAVAIARHVGASGRVLAFEPITDTFELLTANVRSAGTGNITLVNAAVSSKPSVASMELPRFEDTGLPNPYQARLTEGGKRLVLCLALDSVQLPHRVALIKIDAEGHDLEVLAGGESLIARDRPVIIVEAAIDSEIGEWLRNRGYQVTVETGSSNLIAMPGQ
jgi:FkbM family methyltransferase